MVQSVEPREALLQLDEDVFGTLKASEISVDRVEDARNALHEGEKVEVKIISIDRKNRNIGLSIKAKDLAVEKEAHRDYQQKTERAGPTTLGDLIQAQMDQNDGDSDENSA